MKAEQSRTTSTIRPGDLALISNVYGPTFFTVDSVETDAAGKVTALHLSTPGSGSTRVEARRVSAVIANILNPRE